MSRQNDHERCEERQKSQGSRTAAGQSSSVVPRIHFLSSMLETVALLLFLMIVFFCCQIVRV